MVLTLLQLMAKIPKSVEKSEFFQVLLPPKIRQLMNKVVISTLCSQCSRFVMAENNN